SHGPWCPSRDARTPFGVARKLLESADFSIRDQTLMIPISALRVRVTIPYVGLATSVLLLHAILVVVVPPNPYRAVFALLALFSRGLRRPSSSSSLLRPCIIRANSRQDWPSQLPAGPTGPRGFRRASSKVNRRTSSSLPWAVRPRAPSWFGSGSSLRTPQGTSHSTRCFRMLPSEWTPSQNIASPSYSDPGRRGASSSRFRLNRSATSG